MKLIDKIINDLDFKKQKNSSLVSSIEKMKYHDLLLLSDILDKPQFLNSFSSGWNPSHYAVMNNNLEVLVFIGNLYVKNNCDLNQKIQRAKNSVKLGGNTLEICLSNQKLEHYLVLKNFNISEHRNCSYFIQSNSKAYNQAEDKNELNLPFEYSLVNLFLNNYSYVGLHLLEKNYEYDEKQQVIHEFIKNHEYICNNYIDDKTFGMYNSFFDKLIEKKDNISINLFDFFAIPFIKSYDLKKEQLDYSLLRNFYQIYQKNYSEFFEDFNQSIHKEKLINIFMDMSELLKDDSSRYKNIRNFFETFKIENFVFSLNLSEKLKEKNTITKINKI